MKRETKATCPSAHFQCLQDEFCLPLILRCNGVYDCAGREDELDCDTRQCPGLYRCRSSLICIQYDNVCDDYPHCPEQDDELMCSTTCPLLCVCRGQAFFCRDTFSASAYPLLRYLDASGSTMTPANLSDNLLLIHLIMVNCSLSQVDGLSLPNLLFLDIQNNQLTSMINAPLAGVPQLRELSLAGNPMTVAFGLPTLCHLTKLDLSRIVMPVLNTSMLSVLSGLRHLNLSHSRVHRVEGEGLGSLKQLRVIDLRGCPMTWFPRGLLQDLDELQVVHAHTFRMCCPGVLPARFNLHSCFAPSDEISSCDNLLQGSFYSVCTFILSFLAVVGNATSFVFRTFISKRDTKRGHGHFVTHLSVSDFLMGVYLLFIGVADQVYKGTYVWNDAVWRYSAACKLAGFLSFVSSEVSAFIMCLITLDRFLVLRFPFSRLHFSPRSAHWAAVFVWIVGVLLASVPLLPVTSHWQFYSQIGICIPLPVTRLDFAGYDYSFRIFIVLNCVVFLFISMGQAFIYWSVRANSMSVSNTTKKTKDLTVARRLITVAMTDFLCWFPVCVLGLLGANDVSITGEVNIVVAIFAMPLNSAVNPCLYTINIILERRRKARLDKLREILLAQLKARA